MVNAEKVKVTGKKDQKLYRWHTGYPEGLNQKPWGRSWAVDQKKLFVEQGHAPP